jgi:cytosine/adenosine deaminase-related metal-dependent hydrolase
MTQTTLSRRKFVKASATGIAAAAFTGTASAFQASSNGRILLKGGMVLTLDRNLGDFENADVLVEGKKIVAVQPHLKAEAQIIDASSTIVMPGFVNTHQHQYQTILRSILADGLLRGPKSYFSEIQDILTPVFRPEDAGISEFVASLNQINAGVTTGVDVSQVCHTPEHTDACIDGLRKSGRRTVYGYWNGVGPGVQYPQDIRRLRKQYFSSDDQMLTLGMGALTDESVWNVAREVGAPIISHVGGGSEVMEKLGKAGLMREDNEYIHCVGFNETVWKLIADTGGKVSIAPAIEMEMGHGMPPIQKALDHGIRPSLSVDVETDMTADMFTVMRTAFTLQRAFINERRIAGEKNVPRLLASRDVLEMATIEGARVSHLDHKIGTITPGKEADIILLRTDTINVAPLNNAPGAVVTLMDTSNVDTVLIAGKVLKRNGRLVGVDMNKIRRDVETSRDGLLARAKYPKNLFKSCCADAQ